MTDAWAEPKTFARVNNNTVVSFAVFRGKGESDMEVNERVAAAVVDLQKAYPDVTIDKVDNSVSYTAGNYDSAMETHGGRGALRHRGLPVPEGLARDVGFGHRAAALDHSDLLGAVH